MKTQKYIRLASGSVVIFPKEMECTNLVNALSPISGGFVVIDTALQKVTCRNSKAANEVGLYHKDDDAQVIKEQFFD